MTAVASLTSLSRFSFSQINESESGNDVLLRVIPMNSSSSLLRNQAVFVTESHAFLVRRVRGEQEKTNMIRRVLRAKK